MTHLSANTIILGAGMTGLAAGFASGCPVFEAADVPGGICSSYYVRPGERARLAVQPPDEEAYRFEVGGGHWIFGGDPVVLNLVRRLTPVREYRRRSSVFFHRTGRYVPYPLQNNLRFLEADVAERAIDEMARPPEPSRTMREWLAQSFGPTLDGLFFGPFHTLYTAGLDDRIAPQDGYKSPVNLALARQGARGNAPPVGYNVTFAYPEDGLNALAGRLAAACDVRDAKRLTRLDATNRVAHFADGSRVPYAQVLSTLPLNRMMEMAGLSTAAPADPYTSVLVVNVGARKGPRCPADHWLYNCETAAGFHRVGFYSNVDASFLPRSARERRDRVAIYVERAYAGGTGRSSEEEVRSHCAAVVDELREWGFIEDVEAVDPTWIDVAYTWAWPGSRWREDALRALEAAGIYQVGRYARWTFQGIADSIRDGLFAGAALRQVSGPRRRAR